jgi:hypothetical protein
MRFKIMSSSLHAKLKILVAKLYKAEKLYASMRRPLTSDHIPASSKTLSGASRLSPSSKHHGSFSGSSPRESMKDSTSFSSGILIEHANEIRSLEWYEVHNSFRIKLNDILSRGSTPNLSLELNNLWHDFCSDFSLAESYLKETKSLAHNAMEKEEYAHLLKLSSDLVKRKARIQALKVIHDELESLINHEAKQKGSIDLLGRNLGGIQGVQGVSGSSPSSLASASLSSDSTPPPPSNVIPLRRKAV